MKTIKLAFLPFTLIAAVLLGGCVGAEPTDGDEADEFVAQVEPTAEAEAALVAPYNGVCGAGYVQIDSMLVPSGAGVVYLTYNSSTGKNCVVTIRNTPGSALPMNAYIGLSSSPTWADTDPGNFTTYAGPVYVYAPHKCIDWGGMINGSAIFSWEDHCI
jgi:hypothetical protein